MKPLVSVITPIYNSGRYLDAFFQSLFDQDYPNYEIVVINDGSTDCSEDIALRYKAVFESRGVRFVYLSKENGGQASALNVGFPYIGGKYFIWPDSDDVLFADNISAKVDYMEAHQDVALGIAWAEYVDEQGKHLGTLRRTPSPSDNLFEDLLTSKNVVFCPGIFIMRTSAFVQCYPDLRIDESRAGQNYQLLFPVIYRYRWGYIDQVLYKYIKHPTSHSNTSLSEESAQIKRFEEHERLILRLVYRFCREDERPEWGLLVRSHFQGLYLRIANKHGDRRRALQSARCLVSMRRIKLKDCIYALASAFGFVLK